MQLSSSGCPCSLGLTPSGIAQICKVRLQQCQAISARGALCRSVLPPAPLARDTNFLTRFLPEWNAIAALSSR